MWLKVSVSFLWEELPDFSGIFLAALGVALVVFPDCLKAIEDRKRIRIIIAAVLILCGSGGLVSSYRQRRDSDASRQKLTSRIADLQGTVDKFGPKLDDLINRPFSAQQKVDAASIKQQLDSQVRLYSIKEISNKELVDRVEEFNYTLTTFRKYYQAQEADLEDARPTSISTDQDSLRLWNWWSQQQVKMQRDFEREYEDKYYVDAKIYRDELIRRLNIAAPPDVEAAVALQGKLAGVDPLGNLAQYLDWLAKQLPQ